MQRHDVDVLVIGAGLAGLATALSAKGRRVTVLCPSLPPEATASALAQGGIAAAVGEDDSPTLHAEDTLRAGAGKSCTEAVNLLCSEALPAILWLEAQGMRFDQEADVWALHHEAAHSRARVLHAGGDRTGAAVTAKLFDVARSATTVELLSGYRAIALNRDGHRVRGVVALSPTLQPMCIEACDTIIATGGVGQMYRYTTNPPVACGDGLAIALAAGARCTGLEFLQFHPTALAAADDPLPLVTEALRGAGAALINDRGERFMAKAHPAAELAPRDVVAREVWKQIHGGQRAYLDATAIFRRNPSSFPAVRGLCTRHGINSDCEPIPVVPAAHYHMGGIAVDMDGRSSLAHLWACGEVACNGVHGANRLASNSLLEAVVFGRRLGRALATSRRTSQRSADFNLRRDIEGTTLELDAQVWDALRQLMWAYLGIVRAERGLQAGLAELQQLERRAPGAQLLLKNRLQLAQAMFAAAFARKESCGSHFRADGGAAASRADPGQGMRMGH